MRTLSNQNHNREHSGDCDKIVITVKIDGTLTFAFLLNAQHRNVKYEGGSKPRWEKNIKGMRK